MLSNAKHPLAGNALSTVIPREHSDRGDLLADYALSTLVVAGQLRGDSSLKFRMTCSRPTTLISRQSGKRNAD